MCSTAAARWKRPSSSRRLASRCCPAPRALRGWPSFPRPNIWAWCRPSAISPAGLDVLIVDTAAGIADSVRQFCQAAQKVLVVLRDEPASLTDAYALIKVLHRNHGVRRFRILANMSSAQGAGESLFRKLERVTSRFLDVVLEYAGEIPEDTFVRSAIREQRCRGAGLSVQSPRRAPSSRLAKPGATMADGAGAARQCRILHGATAAAGNAAAGGGAMSPVSAYQLGCRAAHPRMRWWPDMPSSSSASPTIWQGGCRPAWKSMT